MQNLNQDRGQYVLRKYPSLYGNWVFADEIGQSTKPVSREERKQRLHVKIRLHRQFLIARDGFIGFTSLMVSFLWFLLTYSDTASFADRGGSIIIAMLFLTPFLFRHIRRRTCAHFWQIFAG